MIMISALKIRYSPSKKHSFDKKMRITYDKDDWIIFTEMYDNQWERCCHETKMWLVEVYCLLIGHPFLRTKNSSLWLAETFL